MELQLAPYVLATPDDLCSRGRFPGLFFVLEALIKNFVPQPWNSTPLLSVCLQGLNRNSQSTRDLKSAPVIWIPKLKLLKWLLVIASSCKCLRTSVGIRPLPIVLELLTATGILVAPQKHFSWYQ